MKENRVMNQYLEKVHRNWNSKMSERPYIVPSSGFPFSSRIQKVSIWRKGCNTYEVIWVPEPIITWSVVTVSSFNSAVNLLWVSLRSITCQLSSSELLFIDWGKLYLSLSKSELAFHSSLMLVMEILKWSEERTNICVSYTLCTALIQVHLKSMY